MWSKKISNNLIAFWLRNGYSFQVKYGYSAHAKIIESRTIRIFYPLYNLFFDIKYHILNSSLNCVVENLEKSQYFVLLEEPKFWWRRLGYMALLTRVILPSRSRCFECKWQTSLNSLISPSDPKVEHIKEKADCYLPGATMKPNSAARVLVPPEFHSR